MFRPARWRNEKTKIKAVFKLQFRASQLPKGRWDAMSISLVPMDTGKPTQRPEKAAVAADGSCQWPKPIYETTKLVQDPKSGKISEKVYQIAIVTSGKESKNGLLAEATMDLAGFAEAFKPSCVSIPLGSSIPGASLHVTVQRLEGVGEMKRDLVVETGGSARVIHHRVTLQSQLCNNDREEDGKLENPAHHPCDSHEEGLLSNGHPPSGFVSSITSLAHTDSNTSETISASSCSDSSSGQFTPNENGFSNCRSSFQDHAGMLSPLSAGHTPRDQITSLVDWSDGVASANGVGSNELRERLQDPDVTIEKLRSDAVALARQVDISELELQSLRKTVVKERKRGLDLSKELGNLQDERDTLIRECEELKASCKKMSVFSASSQMGFDNKGPHPILDEVKQELDHEKNLNTNLRVQLQKMQESNCELILAVRDMEDLLDRRDRGEPPIDDGLLVNGSHQRTEESQAAEPDATSDGDEDKEQYTLEVLVKDHGDVSGSYSLEREIADLRSELEMYKKEREELEIQTEQLALDYEVLRQENHDISSKLEQSQLRDQLRMQYECSAHLAAISDLEAHVEGLEKELVRQGEVFEADLESVNIARVEQEKRAIAAEESLRKARCSNAKTVERLQEDFKKLSAQLECAFGANEKLAIKAMTEASELHQEKCHLEELLRRSEGKLVSARSQFQSQVQDTLSLLDVKTKESEGLLLELKSKHNQLENLARSNEVDSKMFSDEIVVLKTEIGTLKAEQTFLLEQAELKENLVQEIEKLEAMSKINENLVQEGNMEKEALEDELLSAKEDADELLHELDDVRHMMEAKEMQIVNLSSEADILRARCFGLDHALLEKEIEKENLGKEVLSLMSELLSTKEAVADIEIKLRENNATRELQNGNANAVGNLEGATHGDGTECEMSVLKEHNAWMESELKEMQLRYSEISLKFAEVEGERQQLVMTVRGLKNALKNQPIYNC